MIKTVFFDWDYTLVYTRTPENTLGERLAWMFKAAGLPYSREEVERALANYNAEVARGKIKRTKNPQTRRQIARLYAHMLNFLDYPEKNWEVYINLYGTYASLPTFLYDDSRSTLKRVKELGYKLGIISNHSETARPVMEELVGDLVPEKHMIISEEIGIHKPAKTIFRKAAARLRTPPEQCMLVGDNPQIDAIGAVQNGGYALGVWLDRANQSASEKLPVRIRRISSLTQLLDVLNH